MSGIIAYHFWSPTCAPCKVIKPAIEDLKEEFPDVLWRSVNTHDDINDASRTFSVSVVPTIVVTKNGTEVARHSGTNMSIYYSILRKAVAY
jgi:thiol-disulfide isomerase/thioredoxin